jgi:DNA-binding PadR family transcriptional regulator
MAATDVDRFLPLTPVAFEILLAVAESPRHGYDVLLAVERRTQGRLSPNPGTLYRALDRLLKQGLLDVSEKPVEGRESRRIYHLSVLGQRVATAETQRLVDQIGAARARGLVDGSDR